MRSKHHDPTMVQVLQGRLLQPLSGHQVRRYASGTRQPRQVSSLSYTGGTVETPFEYPNIKGTVSRDFLLLVFFHQSLSPQPQSIPLGPFRFFRKFAEIFAAQG